MDRVIEMEDMTARLEHERELFEKDMDEEDDRPLVRPRPAKQPSQVYSIRLPVDRLAELRRYADRRGMAPTALIREWVLQRLDAAAREDELADLAASWRPDPDDESFLLVARGNLSPAHGLEMPELSGVIPVHAAPMADMVALLRSMVCEAMRDLVPSPEDFVATGASGQGRGWESMATKGHRSAGKSYRSAVTGRYVTKKQAKRSPKTTVTESRKKKTK